MDDKTKGALRSDGWPDAAGGAVSGDGIEVDEDDHVLRGVSLIQAVEALGHGVMVDETTLQEVVELGNASEQGNQVSIHASGAEQRRIGQVPGSYSGAAG